MRYRQSYGGPRRGQGYNPYQYNNQQQGQGQQPAQAQQQQGQPQDARVQQQQINQVANEDEMEYTEEEEAALLNQGNE
jgi:hypothetical protein